MPPPTPGGFWTAAPGPWLRGLRGVADWAPAPSPSCSWGTITPNSVTTMPLMIARFWKVEAGVDAPPPPTLVAPVPPVPPAADAAAAAAPADAAAADEALAVRPTPPDPEGPIVP